MGNGYFRQTTSSDESPTLLFIIIEVVIVKVPFRFNFICDKTSVSVVLRSGTGFVLNCNNATQVSPYCCKPFQSDTNAVKGVKILFYCVLLLIPIIGNSLLNAIIKMNINEYRLLPHRHHGCFRHYYNSTGSSATANRNIAWPTIVAGKGIAGLHSFKRLKEHTKVLRNIIDVLIAFMLCIIPINAYGVMVYFVWEWKMPCGMKNFGFAVHFILYANASVNPWIYFSLNDEYRRCFVNILKKLRIVAKGAEITRRSSRAIAAALEKLNVFSSTYILSN
ncbi:uncharacterized protein LOC111327366 [Stylophora pistillata]|uniref:uncharacterized protein LOC111327366 n=1 Tax=Stylophora pistillata TaxID=50429 RepID=UPI000C04228D|nr:uncharacterized protein LOC111327366 [Stylophora pistillata]